MKTVALLKLLLAKLSSPFCNFIADLAFYDSYNWEQ